MEEKGHGILYLFINVLIITGMVKLSLWLIGKGQEVFADHKDEIKEGINKCKDKAKKLVEKKEEKEVEKEDNQG